MIDKALCRFNLTSLSDLNAVEQKRLRKSQDQFTAQQIREWPKTVLESILPYTKAQLINGKQML